LIRRRFVVVGRTATASPDFSLDDIPGTSGRLDVLLRCIRASLLFSHGIRRDAAAYLVLLGGPLAPRVLRVRGDLARFVRPDERVLGSLVQKALARVPAPGPPGTFVDLRTGISVASGGIEAVLADLEGATPFVLEEGAPDVRGSAALTDATRGSVALFVGDHLGFDAATSAALRAISAIPLSIGPVSLHADDAIAVVSNELDRREGAPEVTH